MASQSAHNQSRARGGQVVEMEDRRPLPLQIPKAPAPKSESNTPRRTRKLSQEYQSTTKHSTTRSLEDNKLNHHVESIGASLSNILISSYTDPKQPIRQGTPAEMLHSSGTSSLEGNDDQEKKSSEPSSSKDSSVSANVSDGRGSLAKLSDRADFVESGKSSMRISSSSDVTGQHI